MSVTHWVGAAIVCALFAACSPADRDGDGYVSTVDCDDGDAKRAPDNLEVCNSVDDDCDGQIDDGVATAYYLDNDGDSFGDPASVVYSCSRPEGMVTVADDCDDTEVAVFPGATEVCNGVDEDCDTETDEDTVTVTWYEDNDGDGVGSTLVQGCAEPSGGASQFAGDCDDANPTVGPQFVEVCDGVDQNCNGVIDEGAPGGLATWSDGDSDGYGDPDGFYVSCDGSLPAGNVQNGADCDDSLATVFGGAPELCDDLDNDCDGTIDENIGLRVWADVDLDGYGDPNSFAFSCDLPAGWASNPFDCNDADALAHDDAVELCDGSDNDCDGTTDEDVTIAWWPDADGDSWGSDADMVEGCVPPADVVFVGGDCDDANADTSPLGAEVCDFADNDCDGRTDEGLTVTWLVDADGDSYGNPDTFTVGCTIPANGVQNGDDCDDTDLTISPVGVEVCDLTDNDCDGVFDDGVGHLYWADADSDGVGSTNSGFARDCALPAGHSDIAGDCNDADPAVQGGCSDLTADYATFGVDAARSGHQPGFLAGSVPSELWSETVSGASLGAPVVADGVVYFVSDTAADDILHARDALTGSVLWDHTLIAGTTAPQPTVDVASGYVYVQTVGAVSSTLVAVDIVAGTPDWGKNSGATSDTYLAPLVYNNDVFIGSGGVGGTFAYDGVGGSLLWSVSGPDYDLWTPAGYGGIVWSHVGETLYGRAPLTGGVDMTVTLPAGPLLPTRMSTVPAYGDDVALLVAGDDLVAVDLVAGEVVWTIEGGFSGSPSSADGLGYAIRAGGILQVDLTDGYIVREFVGDGGIAGKPLVTDDVVVAASAGTTFVFDLATGAVRYTLAAGDTAFGDGVFVQVAGASITVQSL